MPVQSKTGRNTFKGPITDTDLNYVKITTRIQPIKETTLTWTVVDVEC